MIPFVSQASDKDSYIITPAFYQAHFTVGTGAAFQAVGITLSGRDYRSFGGGITVVGSKCQLATQNVVFSNIVSGPPINVQSAQSVHIRCVILAYTFEASDRHFAKAHIFHFLQGHGVFREYRL